MPEGPGATSRRTQVTSRGRRATSRESVEVPRSGQRATSCAIVGEPSGAPRNLVGCRSSRVSEASGTFGGRLRPPQAGKVRGVQVGRIGYIGGAPRNLVPVVATCRQALRGAQEVLREVKSEGQRATSARGVKVASSGRRDTSAALRGGVDDVTTHPGTPIPSGAVTSSTPG